MSNGSEQLPTPDQLDLSKGIRAPKSAAPDPIREIGEGKRLTPEEIDKELGMSPAPSKPDTTKPPQGIQLDLSRGIKAPTGRPTPGPTVTPQQAAGGPHTAAPPPYVSPQEKASQQLMQGIAKINPAWAQPQTPGTASSLQYGGGAFLGAAKGGAGLLVGGAKVLHDVASALDPVEGYQHPYEAQKQVVRDVVDIGKGIWDIGKFGVGLLNDIATVKDKPWLAPDIAAKYADPQKFGEQVLQFALTVDGGLELAKATKIQNVNPTEVINSLNQARKGVINSTMKQGAVEKAYVHKQGVAVADEILKAEKSAEDHVKEHVTNLTEKIGDKPVEADSTAQRIKDQATKTVKTEPPGKMMRGKGPRAGIPAAVPSPLDDLIAYINTVKPGQWTWETVKQFRTQVGRAMSRATGPDLAVLTDIYVNDLTPKLAKTAKQYKLEASWNAYNALESKIYKSFPIIEKARAIVEGNGEGASMAQAIKDPAVLHEVIESLKPHGIDADMLRDYSARANKILRESSDFNKSMFRYLYRISPATLVSLPMAMLGREAAGWMGGLALGAGSGFAINYLMHTIRALKLSPELLDEVLKQRKWPGRTPIPKGEGFDTPPPAPPTPVPGVPPSGPPGEPPPAPGVPSSPVPGTPPVPPPVPGGAQPTPEAAAATKAAETPPAKPKPRGRPKKAAPATEAPKTFTGTEKRGPDRPTQEYWAKAEIADAKKQLEKATDEGDKNRLRRKIEELEKDPSASGYGAQLTREMAAKGSKPPKYSEKQVVDSIKGDPEKAKAYDLADPKGKDKMKVEELRRMEAAGEQSVTKVSEGEAGREPGKRPGTTKETELTRKNKQAARVAKKRAEKGSTALGGGGLEITGGGAGSEIIKTREAESAQRAGPERSVLSMSDKEMEDILRTEFKDTFDAIQQTRKEMGKKLLPADYTSLLQIELADLLNQRAAENAVKAQELIKEQEGRKLSPSEEDIRKSLEDEK